MDSPPSSTRLRSQQGVILFLITFFFAGGAGVGVSSAQDNSQLTFSWRANPKDDNVIGYRLYYGSSSRYADGGKVKSGFSYTYYLDFANSQRCRTTASGPVCEQYRDNEVKCEGLNTESPKCTLYGMDGYKYFTMTAYNSQMESNYTRELKSYFGVASSAFVGALHGIYTILLP